jgi:hypothetical protein
MVLQAWPVQQARHSSLSRMRIKASQRVRPKARVAAEKAGLKAGDIVLSILRNGTESTVPVTLQELKESALSNKAGQGEGQDEENGGDNGSSASDSPGLSIQDQTPDIKSQLPTGAPKGPVVTQVAPQSPSATTNIKAQ